MLNQFLFGIYPYIVAAVFLFGSLARFERVIGQRRRAGGTGDNTTHDTHSTKAGRR